MTHRDHIIKNIEWSFGKICPISGGWSGRFIGFREVVLATENVNKLKSPQEILRWIFRIFDTNGTGFILTAKIKDMVEIITE